MILVLGHITARPDRFEEVLRLSEEHVARSRAEPGCIAHAAHRDTEHPRRLVFVEKWTDMAALQAHFRVPATHEFAKALAGLALEPPGIEIFEAGEIKRA